MRVIQTKIQNLKSLVLDLKHYSYSINAIQLINKCFVPFRPGYTDNVFRGIIKGLRINGESVKLKGREMSGNAAVKDCDSDEVKRFAKDLITSQDETNGMYFV